MNISITDADIDVSPKEIIKGCNGAEDLSSIICAIADMIIEQDESVRRIVINSIINEMSINGRSLIEQMCCGLMHWDNLNKKEEE